MPKLSIFLLLLFLPKLLSAQPPNADDRRLKIDYWLGQPNLVQVMQGEKYEMAEEVFGRLLSVADKPSGVLPTLYIFAKLELGKLFALPDGSIVLPLSVIELCSKNKTPEEAKARLAFVLGHELKHVVRGDYWIRQLLQFVRNAATGPGDLSLQRALEQLQWGQELEVRKNIETDADEYGILYASLAGYEVGAINSFIPEYYRALGPKIHDNRINNTVESRIKAVSRRLEEIFEHLDLFDYSARLYAIGKYDAAIELLRKFVSQYPSREVFNNLGLCYYQKAFIAYTKWKHNDRDSDFNLVYRLCTPLDPVSRLEITRRPIVDHRQMFQEAIAKAIENFAEAVARDERYEIALNNLGCAYLLKGELDFAKGNFKKAIEYNPYCKEAHNNLGVAYRTEGNTDQAVTHFLAASSQQADFPEPIFNLGVLSQQTNRSAKAKEYFQKYLQIDATSVYANAVRKYLGMAAPNSPPRKIAAKQELDALFQTNGLRDGRWKQFLTPAANISIFHAASRDTQYFQLESKPGKERIAMLLTTASFRGVTPDGVSIGAPERLLDEKYPYPHTVKQTTKGVFRVYDELGLVFEIRHRKVYGWFIYEFM